MKSRPTPARSSASSGASRQKSGRYTPPTPKSQRHSPKWLLWLMFASLGIGALLIIVNFLAILPGGESSAYLLGGIALLAIGFGAATKYR